MLDRLNISDIEPGVEIEQTFLLGFAQLQQSRNGPYWRLELRDASGTLEAKIWSPHSQRYPALQAGTFIKARGRTETYREQLQLNIVDLLELDEEQCAELDLSAFLPASPRPATDMLAEIESLLKTVLTHKPWRKIVRSVLQDKEIRPLLLSAPAARNLHHAYRGGLLEHSLSVTKLCLSLADQYSQLDRQLLFCAALFHDLGKIREIGQSLDQEYTSQGKLIGHISLGLLMLEPYLQKSGLEPDLALHFRHLIASHHGLREYGSPVVPATAEAFVLHHADNIDAKLHQIDGLFSSPRPEAIADAQLDEWTPWQKTLERALCRPPRTPELGKTASKEPTKDSGKDQQPDKDPGGQQCSLL